MDAAERSSTSNQLPNADQNENAGKLEHCRTHQGRKSKTQNQASKVEADGEEDVFEDLDLPHAMTMADTKARAEEQREDAA